MNKSSIFFSITLTFAALFFFIVISFSILYIGSYKQELLFNKKRSFDVVNILRHSFHQKKGITKELEENLMYMDFTLVNREESIIQDKKKRVRWEERRRKIDIISFSLQDKNYLYIKSKKIHILLLDTYIGDNFRLQMSLLFILIILAFISLYFSILKKLKPLKTLKESIKNIANEDFSTLHTDDKKDEISQLAQEFAKSSQKLQILKESRNVFIRNIMHELKTPITKGQFLIQLPPTDENQESLGRVFYKLESLINEFASIEELISTQNSLNKKEYFLSDLIENATDLLMIDEEKVIQKFEDIKLLVDFKLFSIALKNLIDNGIKYSTNHQVIILSQGNTVLFKNKSEQLLEPIEKYYEAFFKTQNDPSQTSFGLGLYITKHILDANGFSLVYEHKDGFNYFTIVKEEKS